MTRELHPGAWWLWALGLATAASRTTNPFLLVTVLLVVFIVTRACRPDRSSAGGFRGYLILAAVVIGIRVAFRVLFGGGAGSHVLFRLPSFPLPASSGLRAGGPVTAESVVGALYDGLRLATLLVCFGAANVLANPKRLIKAAPAALHEVGVAVTVAVAVAPQLVDSARRVHRARKLRGGGGARGRMHVVRQVLMPVMTDALDRSLMLAAAMDARGHGRVGDLPRRTRRLSSAALLAGLCGVCVGTYALLDGTAPRWLGVPALLVGVGASAAGVVAGNRRIRTTVYRADPWRRSEWVVTACGVAVALGLVLVARLHAGDLNPSASLLELPVLPLAAFVIVLLGALPAVVV
ncbi:MAG TPA: CbiQ family ECF transporter T component [Acidimicrobiales bacterium]|nr:CbiQ family ECF transporter T component [Acidimicrobiales bacterium]